MFVRAALAMTSDLVLFLQPESLAISHANESACAALRYSHSELLTKDLSEIVPPDARDSLAVGILEAQQAAPAVVTKSIYLSRRDGSKVPIEAQFRQVDGPNQTLVVIVGRDVTDRTRLECLLTSEAHQDPLTGLPNRTALNERLRLAVSRVRRTRERFALLLIDLDSFKNINDTWGHPVGDQVLAAVGRRIVRCLRSNDLAVRYGGDEFVALVHDVGNRRDASQLADRIRDAIERPIEVAEGTLQVTGSIGITIADQNGQSALDLLKRADSGMYAAKALGRNGQYVVR
jgi:diguanylate cyclase (GGDEF)-like protein/PAS domain S-box-containing protein